MTISEATEDQYVRPEYVHAYVAAEIKVPNTLIAVGPYVGHAALKRFQTETDLKGAVKYFANTFAFGPDLMSYTIKAVLSLHAKFGVPVLPHGAPLDENKAARVFPVERFEIVYKEGISNILQAIAILHGLKHTGDGSREVQITDILEQPDKLATMIAVFAAAENAIHTAESTEKSEAFKAQFNFIKNGEKPRAMHAAEKDAIQAEIMPFIKAAVRVVLVERKFDFSEEQLEKFVFVLTSPELYTEAG